VYEGIVISFVREVFYTDGGLGKKAWSPRSKVAELKGINDYRRDAEGGESTDAVGV
jgi:hypothetical protein